MKVVGSAGGFIGGQFSVIVVRVGFRKRFWGSGGPPEKRIKSRGLGWLGNGWDRKRRYLIVGLEES